MERRRVVITGIGAVNAVGIGVPDFAQGLREGRPGGAPITQFDASTSPVKIAIMDEKGVVVRTLTDTGAAGINRIHWDLRFAASTEATQAMAGPTRGVPAAIVRPPVHATLWRSVARPG